MIFKCKNCSYKNHYYCCEICKKWFYNENKRIKYTICSDCYLESEKIYLELMNCSDLFIEEKYKQKQKIQFPKLPKKYNSLLIDFDGY